MKIVSCLGLAQREVTQELLEHCGLSDQPTRAPPNSSEARAERVGDALAASKQAHHRSGENEDL